MDTSWLGGSDHSEEKLGQIVIGAYARVTGEASIAVGRNLLVEEPWTVAVNMDWLRGQVLNF